MSRFPRLRRRQDQWSDPHAHARMRLAERLDGPLGLAETTWLDEHLAGCPSCAAMAAAYEDDRHALRALRDQPPEPPRDLWARTAAAIEAESGGTSVGSRRGGLRGLPIGALSGLTVVALVVGVSLLSGSISFYIGTNGGVAGEGPGEGPAAASEAPTPPMIEPTPFAVGAGQVEWIYTRPNGESAITRIGVGEVCHVKASCPDLGPGDQQAFAMQHAPRTMIAVPTRRQAIAIAKTGDASDRVVIVALPDSETPEPTKTPPSDAPPAATASPSVVASEAPSASASIEPSVEPSSEPSATPTLSAEPSKAADLAIASGINVVGESAAFSEDGTWFAFTARAADGETGPDVYLWRVGDQQARPLTDDGASYFASWSGNDLIASRPDDANADDTAPSSVRIDPETGAEEGAGDVWRPAVDPSGRFAIAWDGDLVRADGDRAWSPGKGSLELRRWSSDGADEGSGSPGARMVGESAANDFDVRWNETGEWVAVWIADDRDASMGRLTLYRVDRERGRLEVVKNAPEDVPALPGFSIADGRLAWVTPRGHDGEGSRIQIAAWSGGGVGVVESSPGDSLVVIR